jgi:cytochrome c5
VEPAVLRIIAALSLMLLTVGVGFTAERTPARSGAEIYRDYCAACHSGGLQGAPVANDAAEWTPRLEKGFDALFQNAKLGVDGMPPMGVCMDCSDAELKAAINEMLRF